MAKRLTETEFPPYLRNGEYARVWIDGQAISLGKYGSPASKEKYNRIISEWLSNGRRLPDRYRQARAVVTVAELIADYLDFAETEYSKHGKPTREYEHVVTITKVAQELYGSCPVEDFSPMSFRVIRDRLIAKNLTAIYINQQMARLVRMFRWGVEHMKCPAHVWQTLQAIRGLKPGRQAKKSRKVLPAPEDMIEAVKPLVSRQVRAMIELQLLTGARPGEIVGLRTCDVDTSRRIWQVVPPEHKTADHGVTRVILLGPRAQQVIRPFLRPNLSEYIFSPREALEEIRAARAANRKTPAGQGNSRGIRKGQRKATRPAAPIRDCYDVHSYRRAIWRACEKAYPAPYPIGRKPATYDENGKLIEKGETEKEWRKRINADPELLDAYRAWHKEHRFHPHQLRHNAATRLANEFGIEMAKIILGHTSAAMTLRYAELDSKLDQAREVIGQVG